MEAPPHTRRDAVVDTLHGVAVPDPYRWLEAGDDPEVQQWVAGQNRRTRQALDAIPTRDHWHERLCAFMTLPVVHAVEVRGDTMVVLERAEGAQQAQLVVRSTDDPSAPPRVLVDPAAGVEDAASAVDWYQTSDDGGLVAYGVSEGGSEDSVLRVIRVDTGEHLGVEIPNCRAASVAWEPDGGGFFYTRYPDGDPYHRTVHRHRLGDDPLGDPVVWAEHPTPQAWPSVELSPDGRLLLLHVMVGWGRTDVHLLDRTTGEWSDVIAGVDVVSGFSFADERSLVGTTTLEADRGRVVRVDVASVTEGPSAWSTVVAERDVVVTAARAVGGDVVVATSVGGVDALERWSSDGATCIDIDGVGVASVVQLAVDRSERSAAGLLVVLTGFDQPASVWRLVGDAVERVHPRAPAEIPDITVSHVEYPSRDATRIGIFLIHRADVVPDVTTPAILTGYGGFGITESPVWSATIAAWCEAGGLYAIAGLRGGTEHGEAWHLDGRRGRKQNVFDDFHAAADWLVDRALTSRDRLAIAGGSNGGLLVGAALTQRRDLCRAVWCAVPLLDMIRFPRFLIARLWTDEYGDPDVADEFAWLWAYSPYHRVVDGERYPAVLFTTAEGDSRVDALHARKMAARLQEAAADQADRPVLLFQEGRAGHGVGKPVGKRATEQADVLAFLSWQLGFEPEWVGST